MGLNLGWVYLFMGVVIGSAVIPLWNMMTWDKASGKGAVIAAWSGLCLALITWLVAAQIQGGEITVATLGTNEVMLSGNLVAIFMSAFIHWAYSVFIDPTEYDFAELDKHITLVEQDMSGLTEAEQDPEELDKALKWITRRGYALTFILIFVWPILSLPAGKFTESYFAFWVLVAIAWGFGAALIITVLPIMESSEEILKVLSGMWGWMTGKGLPGAIPEEEVYSKGVDEEEQDFKKPVEAEPEVEGEVEVSA